MSWTQSLGDATPYALLSIIGADELVIGLGDGLKFKRLGLGLAGRALRGGWHPNHNPGSNLARAAQIDLHIRPAVAAGVLAQKRRRGLKLDGAICGKPCAGVIHHGGDYARCLGREALAEALDPS